MTNLRLILAGVLTAVMLLCSVAMTQAADQTTAKLQAQLVWGTDEDKPNDPKLKLLDAKVTEKFKKILKWKNYYEVSSHAIEVPVEASKKVKMSDKCEIELQDFGKAGVEVKLWGEGKCLKRVKQVIPPGEHLVLAGDDKNDTAWFVVLTPQKP